MVFNLAFHSGGAPQCHGPWTILLAEMMIICHRPQHQLSTQAAFDPPHPHRGCVGRPLVPSVWRMLSEPPARLRIPPLPLPSHVTWGKWSRFSTSESPHPEVGRNNPCEVMWAPSGCYVSVGFTKMKKKKKKKSARWNTNCYRSF